MKMRSVSWVIFAAALLAALAGCSVQQQATMRGELTKRDIYLNLMTPDQATQFRAMEKAETDQELLILYCQEIGVYQKWRGVPLEVQPVIRKGRIMEGMSPDEVQMAWGPPTATEDATTPAEREESHERLLWQFDPTTDKSGEVTYRREACFLDGKLLWFKDFHDESVWNRFKKKP